MKNRLKLVLIASVILSIAFSAEAQETWKTKDFDKWDAKDVETILNKSAWVRNNEVRIRRETTNQSVAGSFIPAVVSTGGSNSTGDAARTSVNTLNQGALQPAVDFTFTMRLRSSMAIRLALIRKNQLETDVSKLSEKDRAAFNQRQRGLYDCPGCIDHYVVTLTSKSKEGANIDAVYTTFGNAKIDEIKRYIYLQNENGEKRELVNFVAPKAPHEEAIFYFSRLDKDGNLLFTKENKHLILNFANNEVNSIVNFRFDIAPLVVGDRVDF
jgi:hypothetical protein